MTLYDIYDSIGAYVRSARCVDIKEQLSTGEVAYLANQHPGNWKVVKTDGTLLELPEPPDRFHKACPIAQDWVSLREPIDPWIAVRNQRNQLLSTTDWTQLPDVPEATRARFTEYRKALRDITNQSDPLNIVWPSVPS